MKRYSKGFTLLELLVTLAIISILVMVGAPSFQNTIRSSRLTTAINELSTALSLARSEAVKRNQYVVIHRKGANWESWEKGWQVFVDVDRDGTTAKDNVFNDNGNPPLCEVNEDCLLKDQEALPEGFTLQTNMGNYVGYKPNGTINSNANGSRGGRFYLCSDPNNTGIAQKDTLKAFILNTTGRPRMAIDSDHDGFPEYPGTTKITSCTP